MSNDMFEQRTITATTKVTTSTKEAAEYLREKCKEIDGCQVLSARQLASNLYEIELYLDDITDLWLLGVAVGKQFPHKE